MRENLSRRSEWGIALGRGREKLGRNARTGLAMEQRREQGHGNGDGYGDEMMEQKKNRLS